ncbi:nucleotidyltransferase domain-containing protein [Puia sp.]|uniref:nucleotidyltransferase domain-containing protein n=1 Tax=Puia sp. TaxID=2045100 RepID=UPI002FDEEC2D
MSRLGLFGSYARGEATENSDIDVAVEFNGSMGLNFVAMANEIEDLFGTKVVFQNDRSNPFTSLRSKRTFYMSKCTPSIVVGDILRFIEHIETYTGNLSFDEFSIISWSSKPVCMTFK